MDLVCIRCGEPWDVDHVLHDDPKGFRRRGGLISRCPTCPVAEPQHTPKERVRLSNIAIVAETLGDDIDGLAAALEDFGLV